MSELLGGVAPSSRNIDRYELIEGIGEGGFGVVYKGWDPVLKRHVAIKTCTWDDPDFRQRFVQEAEIAARLQHPNIVTVHDFGEHEGEPYLVQEFLEGEDLDDLIERGEAGDLRTRLSYLRQVAAGLGHAHAHGIVHRDVKPSNVRVGADGSVHIMDFGIAKLLGAERGLTQTGVSVGTAGYMSPEQLEGLEVDARADIFSFGVLAYELVGGERPFRGDTVSSLFYQIVHQEPAPLRELAPDCPPELARLIHRCLEKDPTARYADFAAVIADLDAAARASEGPGTVGSGARAAEMGNVGPTRVVRAGAGESPMEEPSRRSVRRAYIGLGLAAAAVAVFGILNLSRSSLSDPIDPAERGFDLEEQAFAEAETLGAPPRRGTEGLDPDEAEAVGPGDEPTRERGVGGEDAAGGEEAMAGAEDPGGVEGEGERPDPPPPEAAIDASSLSGVLVLVYGEVPAEYRTVENVILSRLAEAGYEVLDEAGAEIRTRVVGSGSELERLGRAAGAAVVVVGELRSDAVASVGGMFTGSASLALRAYAVDGGRLILSESFRVGTGGVPGELGATPESARSEAASRVGHRAVAALRRALARGWEG